MKGSASGLQAFKTAYDIPHGNELVPYEITFMRIGNEFIPTLCWNLHKPKPPKIKTFLMEKGFSKKKFHTLNGLKAIDSNVQKY